MALRVCFARACCRLCVVGKREGVAHREQERGQIQRGFAAQLPSSSPPLCLPKKTRTGSGRWFSSSTSDGVVMQRMRLTREMYAPAGSTGSTVALTHAVSAGSAAMSTASPLAPHVAVPRRSLGCVSVSATNV